MSRLFFVFRFNSGARDFVETISFFLLVWNFLQEFSLSYICRSNYLAWTCDQTLQRLGLAIQKIKSSYANRRFNIELLLICQLSVKLLVKFISSNNNRLGLRLKILRCPMTRPIIKGGLCISYDFRWSWVAMLTPSVFFWRFYLRFLQRSHKLWSNFAGSTLP